MTEGLGEEVPTGEDFDDEPVSSLTTRTVWPTLRPRARRRPDHRFEWTRHEFASWAHTIASSYGYEVRFEGVGPPHRSCGQPTQLAIFDRVLMRGSTDKPDNVQTVVE